MELPKSNDHSLLSKMATNDGHGEKSPFFDGWKAYDNDPYHPTTNPQGVIQMGLAESQLCFDLIEEWIKKNPKWSICTAEGASEFKDIALYQDYHGLPAFRSAIAKFMEKVRGGRAKFNPDRIVMSGGATGAHELVAFCLADPGDAFLVPTPYYPGFDRDLRWRTGVQLVPVVCYGKNDFKITRVALEEAYKKAQEDNIRVKGVIITNPSNPLGTVLDRETLRSIAKFVNEKNIHLVCDEIFAATVFNQPDFIGISEILEEEEEDVQYNLDLFHVVYSLSKDLGFPGFRVGVVYSYNDDVMNCGRKMSSFGLVSTQTQYLIAGMLSDEVFVENFLAESHRRLAARHEFFTKDLDEVGIGCLNSNAGLYCWVDLRRLLKEATVAGEIALWRTIINEVKLNVSPGSSCHSSEPGWFRVCIANMDDETMKQAIKRIRKFVFENRLVGVAQPAKARRWQRSLRLSFKASQRFEDPLSPQCIMSPHSPLVHATT
ncbi:hypothetical protein AAC387_Pa06g0475 [Persea americana]